MDELYYDTFSKFQKEIDKEGIDFLGINISNTSYEVKLYMQPQENYNNEIANTVEKFVINNDLFRCRCVAHSLKGSRNYIALKNKKDYFFQKMLEILNNEYTFIEPYIKEIMDISSMVVSYRSKERFSSFHMLGLKEFNDETVINFEWLTRKLDNTSNPGCNYYYDDSYYFNFLKKLNYGHIKHLCSCIENNFIELLEENKIHFWLVAEDMYSNGNKKVKIYFKIEDCNFIEINKIIKSIDSSMLEKINELNNFIYLRNELKCYGFSIGIDNLKQYTFNYYFIDI